MAIPGRYIASLSPGLVAGASAFLAVGEVKISVVNALNVVFTDGFAGPVLKRGSFIPKRQEGHQS